MNVLITGGAGFIGRWTVKTLLNKGHEVWILDNLSNGRTENLHEFQGHPHLKEVMIGDIKDRELIRNLPFASFEICIHLAASINVQDSIDDPETTFANDALGTFLLLEECRKHRTKMVYMSTCMVYDRSFDERGIAEDHPVKPASPYAGAKLAGENMVLSYHYAYGLPVVVLRPFNTYGPFQKSGGEGGVIPIFIQRKLASEHLLINGNGEQTRDFLYVEDCADFIILAAESDRVNGEILNAGVGRDVTINHLAEMIAGNTRQIRHIPHIHPQSEIMKLLCNNRKADALLGWKPKTALSEGLKITEEWLKNQRRLSDSGEG
ncbi:NAD-dependent epimerase/dehydratase family protein [Ferviditalea candida]|uniref:GDP-mannose 4,6-dehydratase n=1 Tax=Ferviditalea candida TaxID=3108399 RepID=A0ABU5ZI84_9BACL|nr:GDP-mannose 4,6-dehydratase [Paenibacillaceae bacterium T2]